MQVMGLSLALIAHKGSQVREIQTMLEQCQAQAQIDAEYIGSLEMQVQTLNDEILFQQSQLDSAYGDIARLELELAECGQVSVPQDPDPTNGSGEYALPVAGARHIYSQLQPWNNDETKMIIIQSGGNGSYAVMTFPGGIIESTGYSAPRWYKNAIVDVNHDGVTYMGQQHLVGGIKINESYEDVSADGRLAVYDGAYIHVISVETGIDLNMPISKLQRDGNVVNWVRAISGGYAVQYSDGGTWAYDNSGAVLWHVTNHRHSDFDSLGNYYFNEWYYQGSENYFLQINEDGITPIYSLDVWGRVEHVSATGPEVVVTAGTLYQDDILKGAIWLPESGEILGYHESSSSGYWAQPQAAMSPSGRYVAFASDKSGNIQGYYIQRW